MGYSSSLALGASAMVGGVVVFGEIESRPAAGFVEVENFGAVTVVTFWRWALSRVAAGGGRDAVEERGSSLGEGKGFGFGSDRQTAFAWMNVRKVVEGAATTTTTTTTMTAGTTNRD